MCMWKTNEHVAFRPHSAPFSAPIMQRAVNHIRLLLHRGVNAADGALDAFQIDLIATCYFRACPIRHISAAM